MTEDTRMLDPLAQPFAVEGIPLSKSLTIGELTTIGGSLKAFATALRGPETPQKADGKEQGEPAKQQKSGAATKSSGRSTQAGPGSTDNSRAGQGGPHCLVLTGYLGEDYRAPGCDDEGKRTEEALIKACERHFRKSSGSSDFYYPFETTASGEENSPGIPGPTARIDVILESGGGSLDSAFRVVLYLRKFAKDIRIYVPWRAKSAATLLAIGADQIVMSPYAELGPLDTQIADPRSPNTFVSALDCYQSVDYVRDFGVESISRALKAMLDKTQKAIPLTQLIDSATSFAIGDVKPMLEQVKALDFGAWGRTLKIGETYARALRRRLHDPDTKEDAEKIADKLVYCYPHHHYGIDIEEAKNLRLAVGEMPKKVYEAAEAVAAACRGDSRIGDSRFVGFSEDVDDAISRLKRLDGASRGQDKESAGSGTASEERSEVAFDRVPDRIPER